MPLSWTEWCFVSVIIVCMLFFLVSLRYFHARVIWRRVLRQPIAASAAIIFICFLLVGILDSIHGNWHEGVIGGVQVEQASILEHVLAPLGSVYEKTYSAPLALTLYDKEVVIVNGVLQQDFPPVQYSSHQFADPHEKNQFILHTLWKAALIACLLTSVFFVVLKGCRIKLTRQQFLPLLTFFMCVFFIFACYGLSRGLHVFGTGKIGQDIFYYAVKSIRTGLVIGILTTLFMLPFAIILGISAGYFGGKIDDVIQYIYTTLSSIPGVLLITASVLSMQTYIANHPAEFPTLAQSADARLLALCLILGVTNWTNLCRILRAEALKWREIDFVSAAKVLGTGSWTILRRHLLPNILPIIIITLVLDFSFLVLAEAVLSYVGVGVSPLTMSWGNMINGARLELARDPIVWWPMGAAFLLMFMLVLASNLLVDALRDAFDEQ